MKYSITFLLIAIFSLKTINIQSQNKKAPPCSSKEYKQFDFWIGNWNVYNTNNQLIGTNKIVRMNNACTIQENWESKTSSNKGTSYNYYNNKDKSWNQLWISNTGGVLALKGNRIGNKMILKSEAVKNKKGDYYNKITWTKKSDGSVEQLWQIVDINDKILSESFKGLYKKEIK